MSGVEIKGIVKWFNNSKGFGFVIANANPDEDLFAHFSQIKMEGYKTLKAGQPVTFRKVHGPKGLQAEDIKVVEVETLKKPAAPCAHNEKKQTA